MNLDRVRNTYGLVPRQMKVLRFIYKQGGRAFSRDVGKEITPDEPTKVYPTIYSLERKGFVRRAGLIRGYYELTPSGKRVVAEMGDE